MDIHERARVRRKELGLTQQEVADKAGPGVSLRTYQNFETGKTNPQGGTLRSILRALGFEEEAASEEIAEDTRAEWPLDVRIFRDVIGAWLMTFSEDEREHKMQEWSRRIFPPKGEVWDDV